MLRSGSSLSRHRSTSANPDSNRQRRDANTIHNLEEAGLLYHQPNPERRNRPAPAPTRQPSEAARNANRNSGTSDLLRRERAITRAQSTRDRAKRHLGYASAIRSHWQSPQYSHRTQASFDWRSGHANNGMMETERTRTRPQRTFIGSECAVCEEPLEHTLRGERILQFSCSHVSHEACFYEYIKEVDSQYCPTCNAPLGLDTSRGGNVLDLEKLSNIVRSVAQGSTDSRSDQGNRSTQNTPTPWDRDRDRDSQTIRDGPRRAESVERGDRTIRDNRNSRDTSMDGYPTQHQQQHRDQRDRYNSVGGSTYRHGRNGSTGQSSSNGEYNDTGRRHDYDLDAMETDLSSPRASLKKNPIPPPQIAVRSEYPTLTRSKQPQTLTCLVTIEVPEGRWRPTAEDLRPPPPLPNIHDDGKEVVQQRPRTPEEEAAPDWMSETPQELEEITQDLRERVENWHGLDFSRFGKLSRHGTLSVSRDKASWQELECFLFAEMLICIKEKRGAVPVYADGNSKRKLTKCTLRGSILIKKHLRHVESATNEAVLSLGLAVQELSKFHLRFGSTAQLEAWKRSLLDLIAPPNAPRPRPAEQQELDNSGTEDEEWRNAKKSQRVSSGISSWGGARSQATAPTEYTNPGRYSNVPNPGPLIHIPLDLVVVIPVSTSMQGVKINLLRDALRFVVQNLGERDRMGLVTFGSSQGGVPLVGMTTKTWPGWNKVLGSIRPVGQKSKADVVEGANAAMDLLMQRRSNNPISSILLISDSHTTEGESVDFVTSRAEAAKVTIHSFGLGTAHNPTTMIDLSGKTKASYTYVKDWMMLRECLAGCLGSLQNTSHQNAKLRLRLPEGSPAKFAKIQGALNTVKRLAGREAECTLGDLRFGDKRDVLVQLVITPDNSPTEEMPQDQWESIISGLEALGGASEDGEQRAPSVEEVPLLQADLVFGDLIRDCASSYTRPSLLTITMLPANPRASRVNGRPPTPPIPPHTYIVQRRMEMLTADMLTRGLLLMSRGHVDRAKHLLIETKTILKGLAKGGLPPVPPPSAKKENLTPNNGAVMSDTASATGSTGSGSGTLNDTRQPSPNGVSETPRFPASGVTPGVSGGIDPATLYALETELNTAVEWLDHPTVFGRDSRKAVFQAIGVISSQRAYTFRSPAESLWAGRISGIKTLTAKSREWKEVTEGESLTEE